ncbi:hypothetical protein [Duganella sp. S19_KUP01_CR8]|uniref:hypothetical protein n=1 Tax=Duganella sp. S19_KUP01_CR8 TaxID=3025502 RepID=UPI002FCDA652
MAMMTSQALADLLRSQAQDNDGLISLNDQTLQTTGLDALVARDLLRASGTLLLLIDPASVPAQPPAAGFTVAAAVPAGDDGFLRLDQRQVELAFAVGETLDLSLAIQTRRNAGGASLPWVFSDSFVELTGQPYDDLNLVEPRLGFATAQSKGLGFSGQLALDGIFQALATLMSLSGKFALHGDLLRDKQGKLGFTLEAGLGLASFGIDNIITLQSPRVGVSYARANDANGVSDTLVRLYLAAEADFGAAGGTQVQLDIISSMPLIGAGAPLQLAVLPKKFTTSLGNLGSLVAGQSWDSFFAGPAAELKPYFDTFGLLGYSMCFGSSGKVTSLNLSVGTLKPWKLWSDAYQLTLDANWDVQFLGRHALQTLQLHAGFNYDGKMQFDVTVTLPELHISGTQSGAPIRLTARQAVDKLFGAGAVSVPEELLSIAVSDFNIEIDKAARTLAIGFVANAGIALFGAQILTLRGMSIGVLVDASGPEKLYTGTLNGQISLGPIAAEVDATLSNDPDVGCVLTIHLVDETVGTMLGHLVHLVDPTLDITLGEPWDRLLDISLDAFVLTVDLTKKTVSLAYVDTIDLGFLTLTQLGLTWQKNAEGPSTTRIVISGNFLGVGFGAGSSNPPLAWDPINENPPAVPGAGDKLSDLRYAGIGQHVGFDPSWQPTNVEDVIDKMSALALPAGGGNLPNLTSPDGLRFAKDSSWLVGADFTIMETLRLAVVFNDPKLYGILIGLSGERAKSFGGLKFEILYRKVSDSIGVYHIELKLPDAMRHLEFGAVSLTLPVVIIDIYTNGNFRVDLGFPKGLDFSASFCLQVFPFVGYGGFYFAVLDGDTSSRVPQISNGRFSPVIEFGIALSVGVGKTIDEGILSGGLSVTVVGILEGVIGWFHPTDAATPKGEYYWLQGTVAITGRLYGSIDFAIIQASLSVTAYACITLLIEAHQPIHISMSVGVSVEVSVKIVFFTIHCSFSTTISAAFTIGNATPTPWIVAQPANGSERRLFAQRGSVHASQQRVYARLGRLERLALMNLRLALGEVSLQWQARTVFDQPRALTLHAMPAFTKADGEVAGVLLLGIENGIDGRAASLAAHVAPGADSRPGIADVLEGLTRWAILNARASLGKSTSDNQVDAEDIALLSRAFADTDALASAVDYQLYLKDFLDRNFRFALSAPATSGNGDTGVSLFPMPPVLKMTAGGVAVDFARFNQLDELSLDKMQAYFELMAVNYQQFVAGKDDAPPQAANAGLDQQPRPIAQVVFEQYVAMQLRAAIKASGDCMESFAFSYADRAVAFSLADIRTQLGAAQLPAAAVVLPNRERAILRTGASLVLDEVRHQIKLGERFAGIAASFNAVLPPDAQISALQIAQHNQHAAGLFNTGTAVDFSGLHWTTLAGESLNLILARLAVRTLPATVVQGYTGLQTLAQAILALPANAALFPAGADPIAALNSPIDPALHPQVSLPASAAFSNYATVAGDNLIRIAATSLAIQNTLVDLHGLIDWTLSNNALAVTDPDLAQPAATLLALPPVAHALEAGESIASLAARLLTGTGNICDNLLALPETINLLAPHGLLALPPLNYALRAGDTFGGIAAQFNLALAALEQVLEAADTTAIFAAGASPAVGNIAEMTLDALTQGLAATHWKTIAPMASRFMLAGLRLPDPNDADFRKLTLADMRDPRKLGAIATLPLYVLTGQQLGIAAPPPAGYTIAFELSAAAPWFDLPQALSFGLGSESVAVINQLKAASFAPVVELAALPPFRLAADRYTLQKHIAWQPALLSAQAIYNPTNIGNVAGNPDLWLFPDQLISRLNQDSGNQMPCSVAIATHQNAGGMTVKPARAYAWATQLRFSVQQLPADEAATPAAATIVGMLGTDDHGIALLDALDSQLRHDDATLYLLYAPGLAAGGGLLSDQLTAQTVLMQTNLSTLSHSGNQLRFSRAAALRDSATGEDLHVAPIGNAAAFLRLVRDGSIVRSGGYYLRYINANGGQGLPARLFSNGTTAELTLLVVLDSQNKAHAPILPFNNCAIVADNIDAADSNVFVQSPTWLVGQPSSLADAAAYALATFGLPLDAAAVATLNADVPQLLRPGASLQVPDGKGGSRTVAVALQDTLASLAARYSLSPAGLAAYGANATAALLAPTGLVQFHADALVRTAAIPAGSAGYELSRRNPDPGNRLALNAMDGAGMLEELYHMAGNRIVVAAGGRADFLRSSEGVPTGPTQSRPTEDGALAPSDSANPVWDYHQAIACAPFAAAGMGAASPALPEAAQSPYAGVGPAAQVSMELDFHDPYGNALPLPGGGVLTQPVRYFDDLVGPGQWPSSATAYTLAGDGTAAPQLTLELSLQLDKYLGSATLASALAAQHVATDKLTYLRAYYQLAQPDIGFSLACSLAPDAQGQPAYRTLQPHPFREFVNSAWVVLDALSATTAEVWRADHAGTTLGTLAARYGVALAELLAGNGDALYSQLLGQAQLNVPALHTSVAGDSLDNIAAAWQLDPVILARQNPWAALSTAIDLAAPQRRVTPSRHDSLADIARDHQCSVSGIAVSNPLAPLADRLTLAVAGIGITTQDDSFTSAAQKFAALGLSVTLGEVALANQGVAGLFAAEAGLAIDDLVPAPGDSLGSLEQAFGFGIATLAAANASLANLYAAGTSLYIGAGTPVPAPGAGITLAQFAAGQNIGLASLGLALYDGLQSAEPAALNQQAPLAATASMMIPATVSNQGGDRHAPYRAQVGDDDIASLAAKFLGRSAATLGELNVAMPGLFLAGATVRDVASGKTVTTEADSNFATLVAAFAAQQVSATPASLARDNADTPALVRPGGLWLCPPMVVLEGDSLLAIALRYGLVNADGTPDAVQVARGNAAVLGFLAAGVALSFDGISLHTQANDTFNALLRRCTRPGRPAPSLAALALAVADLPLLAKDSLILPFAIACSTGLSVKPGFSAAISELSVSLRETRQPDWIAADFQATASVGCSQFEVPPQTAAGGEVLSLGDFATRVEAALPGVRLATGDGSTGSAAGSEKRLWLVNFGYPGAAQIDYRFEGADQVRSFALPPLSTSLVSGSAAVRPYVSGQGLDGAAQPQMFAGIDLDNWGSQFLSAMDMLLSPVYALPAHEENAGALQAVIAAKGTLAAAIAGRTQYVLDGGGPGEYGETDPRRSAAIAALRQSLQVSLASAYSVSSLIQAVVDVGAPYDDPVTAPRLSGRPKLSQPHGSQPIRNASLSNGKVVLARTSPAAPALATFLLSVQSPASQRNFVADLDYSVAEIEVPSGPPDEDGYQSSSWLTLIHPLDDGRGRIDTLTLPVPLRCYPLPPTLEAQAATASYPDRPAVTQLTRWDAAASYSHQDADQDSGRLLLEVGVPFASGHLSRQHALTTLDGGSPLFAALAQFIATYPALQPDLAQLTQRTAGSAASPVTTQAVQAFADMASAVAAAWPADAVVPKPLLSLARQADGDEIAPGSYAYTLQPAPGDGDLTRLQLGADRNNTASLWPMLAVDRGAGLGWQALAFTSASGDKANYNYPPDTPRGKTLRYQVSLAGMDVVMVQQLSTSVAVERNADLVSGAQVSPLFVYATPYTSFASTLVPLLDFADDYSIGRGELHGLEGALGGFLATLLARSQAPAGATCVLRVAAAFSYLLTGAPGDSAAHDAVQAASAGLSTAIPVALIPAIELIINGDGATGVGIAEFAGQLTGFVIEWDKNTQPSHQNAAVNFEIALFSRTDGGDVKPLLELRAVRYWLSS